MATRNIVYDGQIFSLQQYGGISRYICELASRVHRLDGYQACVTAGVHFNVHLNQAAVPRLGAFVPLKLPRTGRVYRAMNSLWATRLIRSARPSLVHRTYYSGSSKRPIESPVVLTVHDMIHEIFPAAFSPRDPTSRNKRLSVANADHIVCVSQSTARDLTRIFDVDPTRISVTHLGYADAFATPPVGTSDRSPHARPYLLYVGHRGGYKNFETALQAYARSSLLRNEVDLMVFGGPPFSAPELSKFDSLGLRRGSVSRHVGSDRELARAYRHARALVYPSRYEGFGIPPLEAMASGCPVACAATSSLPEVVGAAALLFDPMDEDAVAAAMETTATDEAVRRHLIAAGRERASKFSWDRCAADTVAAYRRVLGQP